MASVRFDIEYTAERDRLSSALRVLYAIPHLVIVGALGYVTSALSVVQWFIILFTGKRHDGIWTMLLGILNWQARAYTYTGLMYDAYPNFGFEPAQEPVSLLAEIDEPANRLTCALRIIWAIPAIIVMMILTLAGLIVTIVSWFAIVITGSQSRGTFDFLLKVHRYSVRTNAYTALITDTYPAYE
jgi:hypothetical protein